MDNFSFDINVVIDEMHTVQYALSRSMSPAMVADYTLHLPDKDMLENKLRELTDFAYEDEENIPK